jgi:hypothetical protein
VAFCTTTTSARTTCSGRNCSSGCPRSRRAEAEAEGGGTFPRERAGASAPGRSSGTSTAPERSRSTGVSARPPPPPQRSPAHWPAPAPRRPGWGCTAHPARQRPLRHVVGPGHVHVLRHAADEDRFGETQRDAQFHELLIGLPRAALRGAVLEQHLGVLAESGGVGGTPRCGRGAGRVMVGGRLVQEVHRVDDEADQPFGGHGAFRVPRRHIEGPAERALDVPPGVVRAGARGGEAGTPVPGAARARTSRNSAGMGIGSLMVPSLGPGLRRGHASPAPGQTGAMPTPSVRNAACGPIRNADASATSAGSGAAHVSAGGWTYPSRCAPRPPRGPGGRG